LTDTGSHSVLYMTNFWGLYGESDPGLKPDMGRKIFSET
jgi:hypothetical protein